MRARISWLLCAISLLGATTATAQSFPCASVAPEVRERVREAGACRDVTPDDAAPQDAASSTVTVRLSDGSVVRVPREISSSVGDGRERAATNETAARASTQSEPGASGDSAPALQKLKVPDVIGRSYADAGRALAEFKVDRIETASAAPGGEVLAQEPAPATLMLPGSTVSLQVSDGSLASAAGTTAVTAPAAAAAASPAQAPATAASTAAPAPASEPNVPPEPRGRFPIALSANAALILSLILGAGVLLGLLFGALLMRQWLRRREPAADEYAAPPTLSQHQQPVETSAGGDSETGAAHEVRFAARRDPGETTIVFAPLPGGGEVAIERSSDHHA